MAISSPRRRDRRESRRAANGVLCYWTVQGRGAGGVQGYCGVSAGRVQGNTPGRGYGGGSDASNSSTFRGRQSQNAKFLL